MPNEGIIVSNTLDKRDVSSADTVIIAVSLKADDKLFEAVRGKDRKLYALGNCREPRNILGAIWNSYLVASTI